MPTGAAGAVNPARLFADGQTTTTVTITNINRNSVLVPNGTVVAVTAQPVYSASAGGTILGGTPSPDPRFKLFTTVGAAVTLTYQSPLLDLGTGSTTTATIQVAAADAAGTPLG